MMKETLLCTTGLSPLIRLVQACPHGSGHGAQVKGKHARVLVECYELAMLITGSGVCFDERKEK